jgi:ribonuclease D
MPVFNTGDNLTPESLAALPLVQYEGQICLLASPEEMAHAMDDIRQEPILGFDTETRPAFHKGESYLPSLVQVATERAVYLFPLQRIDCSAVLTELLQAPGKIKAGVALAHDLKELRKMFPFDAVSVADLGAMAKRHGLRQTGLRNLAGILMGVRIAKGNRTSNWASPRLTPAQIRYAATDAWVCRELFLRLNRMDED